MYVEAASFALLSSIFCAPTQRDAVLSSAILLWYSQLLQFSWRAKSTSEEQCSGQTGDRYRLWMYDYMSRIYRWRRPFARSWGSLMYSNGDASLWKEGYYLVRMVQYWSTPYARSYLQYYCTYTLHVLYCTVHTVRCDVIVSVSFFSCLCLSAFTTAHSTNWKRETRARQHKSLRQHHGPNTTTTRSVWRTEKREGLHRHFLHC
jgi:hypothetical protein